MSILIENELIYLAIPKTGCISITNAIIKSNLNYELAPALKKEHKKNEEKMSVEDSEFVIRTFHYRLDQLKHQFGNKKTISIKRNHLDKFLSTLNYCYHMFKLKNLKPKISLSDFDNEYIYKLIDNEFIFLLENYRFEELLKYFVDDVSQIKDKVDLGFLFTFASSSYMKCGYNIDYEFDITELHLLEKFLNDKYGSNVKIEKLNSSEKITNNIIKNTELGDFVWGKFEKKYCEKKLI
jgi:hypothetical protein